MSSWWHPKVEDEISDNLSLFDILHLFPIQGIYLKEDLFFTQHSFDHGKVCVHETFSYPREELDVLLDFMEMKGMHGDIRSFFRGGKNLPFIFGDKVRRIYYPAKEDPFTVIGFSMGCDMVFLSGKNRYITGYTGKGLQKV